MTRIQMPPKAISRAAWTPAERIGAIIIVWAALITAVAIAVIVWQVVT